MCGIRDFMMMRYINPRFIIIIIIRQGGVLSPYLLEVYVDNLITQLRQSGYCIHVCSCSVVVLCVQRLLC